MSHYLLPDGNVQISFSGGRTSGYMLHQILEANGGLPDRAKIVFSNTGREMPETLDFVHEVSEQWSAPIVWLEYVKDRPFFKVVDYATANKTGEPFDEMLEKRKVLPNVNMRFCTSDLKVRPAERYLRAEGWKQWTNFVGIRFDEARRQSFKTQGNSLYSWTRSYPLVDAKISKHDVAMFWKGQSFDLKMENLNGSNIYGNCDGCFCKSEQKLAELIKEHPERAKWWLDKEEEYAHRGSYGRWSQKQSRKALHDFVNRQGDWIFDAANDALCQADDGECGMAEDEE